MDTFSHGFWIGAAYKVFGRKISKKFNIWLAAWWGVFPDVLSFTLSSVWILWAFVSGQYGWGKLPRPDTISQIDSVFIHGITSILYNLGHSLFIFILIFILVSWIAKRVVWEMMGWMIHILMDIPTHPIDFYPTPFLWPISDYRFDGWQWEVIPLFWLINYSAIILVILWFRHQKHKKKS